MPNGAGYRLIPSMRRYEIDELDIVTLGSEVETDEGEHMPAGAVGTVVAVWEANTSFEVEFSSPFHALATVNITNIVAHRAFEG